MRWLLVSPRTGRPKVDNPQNIEVKARLNKETNDRLERFCKENKINKAEAIRMAISLLLGQ